MKRMTKAAWSVLLCAFICVFFITCFQQNDSRDVATAKVQGVLPAELGGATAPDLTAELAVAGGAVVTVSINPDGTLSAFIPAEFTGKHLLTISFFIPYGGPATAGAGSSGSLLLGQASMTVYLHPGLNLITFDLSSITFPDDDGDGLSNLDELILGTDPLSKNVVEQYLPILQSYYGVEIRSLYFTSEDEGWAVGKDYSYKAGCLMMHYQSGVWKVVDNPCSGTDPILASVHFTSSDEGWAVGATDWNSFWDVPQGSGLILHYQSGQWSPITPPDVGSANWILNSVCFPSADEGWAVGQNNVNGQGVMLHYAAGSWSVSDLSGLGLDSLKLMSVHFLTPAEGWAAGYGDQDGVFFGVLLHYSDGSWSLADSPRDIFDGIDLRSVEFTGVDEGWAVGLDNDSWGAAIMHFSGGAWSREDLSSLEMDSGTILNSVSFPTPDEGWAVGNPEGGGWAGTLLHFQNGAWSQVSAPFVEIALAPDDYIPPPTFLYSVHFPASNRGWVGGSFSTYNDMGDVHNALILSDDAGSWAASNPPIMEDRFRLRDLCFPDASEGWAVGDLVLSYHGIILHAKNGAWSSLKVMDYVDFKWGCGTSNYPCYFRGVDFPSPSLGWVVGSHRNASHKYVGGILHYDSGSWSDEPMPVVGSADWYLDEVDFPATDQGWAVGGIANGNPAGGGVILRCDSGLWSNVALPDTGSSTWSLSDVSFPSTDQGWAVGWHQTTRDSNGQGPGDRGIILHYDAGAWSNVALPDVAPGWGLYGVDFPSSDEGWAVGMGCQDYESGCAGVILHYSSGAWQVELLPEVSTGNWALYKVSFPVPGEGWAVGALICCNHTEDYYADEGLIMHYSGGKWQVASDLVMKPRDAWTVYSVACADHDNCFFAGNELLYQGLSMYTGLILKY